MTTLPNTNTPLANVPPPAVSRTRPSARWPDALLALATRGAALAVVAMLGALLFVLVSAAWPAVREFGLGFLAESNWRVNALERPLRDAAGKVVIEDGEVVMQTIPPVFGAAPVIWGTAVSSAIALIIAVPLSLGAALFLVRVAPRLRVAGILSYFIEFLASIPSLAYGIWGLLVLAPFLQEHIIPVLYNTLGQTAVFRWMFYETVVIGGQPVERQIPFVGRNMLAGGVVLAIMIIPIITSLSRDVLRSVPRHQIEGSLALGATWWQSSWLMLTYGRSGLFGAIMLGLARAAGETMAVTMVIGNNNQIAASILEPAQTMASLLANEFAEAGPGLHRSALLYVALILLVMSLLFNVVARWLVVGKGGHKAAGN